MGPTPSAVKRMRRALASLPPELALTVPAANLPAAVNALPSVDISSTAAPIASWPSGLPVRTSTLSIVIAGAKTSVNVSSAFGARSERNQVSSLPSSAHCGTFSLSVESEVSIATGGGSGG